MTSGNVFFLRDTLHESFESRFETGVRHYLTGP